MGACATDGMGGTGTPTLSSLAAMAGSVACGTAEPVTAGWVAAAAPPASVLGSVLSCGPQAVSARAAMAAAMALAAVSPVEREVVVGVMCISFIKSVGASPHAVLQRWGFALCSAAR